MPDEFVRSGEIVLVDMPAESLRRRITDGLTRGRSADDLNRHRKLTAELGGTYIQAQGPTREEALAMTARAQDAGVIVVGRHWYRLAGFFLGSVSERLRRLLPEADVPEVPKS